MYTFVQKSPLPKLPNRSEEIEFLRVFKQNLLNSYFYIFFCLKIFYSKAHIIDFHALCFEDFFDKFIQKTDSISVEVQAMKFID